jgi:hypothetical protein
MTLSFTTTCRFSPAHKENLTMKLDPARTFRDLIVWQKAHQLVLEIHRYTRRFPKEEIYCLSSQFRRAAVSTPANIAEGIQEEIQER